jgi:hypothetical protein
MKMLEINSQTALSKNLKAAEQKDENMVREVILPYVDRQIASAEKKSG